jgi:hypothetical protein
MFLEGRVGDGVHRPGVETPIGVDVGTRRRLAPDPVPMLLTGLLGPEHPDTLLARANLGSSYWSAGRTADAIAIGEQVVADRERLLGSEHPDTLTARANLEIMRRDRP